MGWTPTNKMLIERDYKKREIVITWINDVTGQGIKRFKFEEKEEAFKFAAKEFNQLAM